MKKILIDYLDTINIKIDDKLKTIKDRAVFDEIPIVSDEIGRLLWFLTTIIKPNKILELGTGISYSTHWMLFGYKQSSIISIDQNTDRLQRAEYFLKKSNLWDRVSLYNGWVENFFVQNNEKFDMIFLDSDKSGYHRVLNNIIDFLNPAGVLVADNTLFKQQVLLADAKIESKYLNAVRGIKKFNQAVKSSSLLKSFFFSLGDGVLLAQKI